MAAHGVGIGSRTLEQMPVKTCPTCGGRFKRLDRHLTGRRGCAAAAEAARRARTTAAAPGSPEAAAEPPPRPPTPEDLGPAGKRLWGAVTETFILDPHTLATLESACRELDRAHAAEQALTRAGEFVLDRYQQAKAHPAIAVARSSRLAAARLVQALGLPDKES
jgi:phage terminase small subunit